jgi:hypothetical protein
MRFVVDNVPLPILQGMEARQYASKFAFKPFKMIFTDSPVLFRTEEYI